MGFSLSWAAVRGKPAEVVHSGLGLTPTGERTDIPEGAFCAAELDGGWVLVVADDCDLLLAGDILARLSTGS